MLAGLGPWGLLIGAAITVAVNVIRNRLNPAPVVPAPVTPANPANPVVPTPVAPAPASRPVRDALLAILAAFLDRKASGGGVQMFGANGYPAPGPLPDTDHETAIALLKVFGPNAEYSEK